MGNKEAALLEVFVGPLAQVVARQRLFSEPCGGLGDAQRNLQEMR
jgi:hypothetical protein